MKIENSLSKCKIDFVSNTFSQEILRMLYILNYIDLKRHKNWEFATLFFQATKSTSIEEEQHEQVKK